MTDDQTLWGPFRINGTNDYVKVVRGQLNEINRTNLGRKLFAAIKMRQRSPIVIGGKRFETMKVMDRFVHPLRPNQPEAIYDPDYVNELTFEPTQRIVTLKGKAFIYLFHELIHCLHTVSQYFSTLGQADEEFRTIGLYQYERHVLTENALREAIGLPRRPVYAWLGINKSILEQEKSERKRQGLPENPRDYLRGVEDNFAVWNARQRKQWQREDAARKEHLKRLQRLGGSGTFGYRTM